MNWTVRRWASVRHLARAAALIAAVSCVSDTASAPRDRVPSANGAGRFAPRPNIVFLLADDMRYDAVGAGGNAIIKTPRLDALANDGVLFRNAYASSPICNMSRASIFTGQYTSRHGILDFDTDFSPSALAQTYPLLMRAAGYRTGFIGKYGVGTHMPVAAFDYWKGFAGQGVYEQTDSAGKPIHLTALMANQAIDFLRSQPRGQPFMLSVSFKSPHPQDEDARQFIPDPADMGMYADVTMPVPPTAGDAYFNAFPDFFKKSSEARNRWAMMFATPDMYQTSVRNYYRLVSGMDRAVGQIRDELKRLGLDRNTIIVFASDNGFLLGEHGLSHKWYGFEESVRVPLVIYDPLDPAGQGGRFESGIALNVDFAPTFLDMAGLPVPAAMQGQSLVPLVHGAKPASWRTDFLFEDNYVDPGIRQSVGVVGGRYKYLKYTQPSPNYEVLYDLVADPLETTNFAQDPRYQTILENLRSRYQELQTRAR